MKHGRPDRAWVQLTAQRYSGTHAGAWVGDLMEWRRQHAQCVWQAMQAVLAVIGADIAGAWDGSMDGFWNLDSERIRAAAGWTK